MRVVIAVIVLFVMGAILGSGLVYVVCKEREAEFMEMFGPKQTLADELEFEFPVEVSMTQEVMNGNLDEFYKVSCLKISLKTDLYENELPLSMRDNARALKALRHQKVSLLK